jgi:hypothetical protein
MFGTKRFWFNDDGGKVAGPARTLKNFLALLNTVPTEVITGHANRGDFSRWIADVFHDHALASEIRKVEQRFRLKHIHDLNDAIAKLIQERYEFSPGRAAKSKFLTSSEEPARTQVYAAHSGV